MKNKRVLFMCTGNPSSFEGTIEEKIDKTREVKEKIKIEVLKFIDLVKEN